jgi:hypothetical protein
MAARGIALFAEIGVEVCSTANARRPRREATLHVVNLDADPEERKPYNYSHVHTWVFAHVGKFL